MKVHEEVEITLVGMMLGERGGGEVNKHEVPKDERRVWIRFSRQT